MAYKQDNPNVGHTNHSSDSESDSVDSSRSETDVQETTTAVLETRPEPLPRDDSVLREGQNIVIGGITKDLEELNMGSDSSAVKDFQPATINPSGDDLPEGRTASPVQASENPEQQQASPKTSTDAQLSVEEQRPDDVMLNPLDNTIGSHARDQQSLREDSEVLKLRSDFEEYKRSVSIQFEHTAVEIGQMQAKLNAMASAYEANVLKLWPEKLAAVTKEVSEVRKKLTEMAATNEEEILKLQSDFEKFQESTRQNFQNAVETVIEMQKKLNEIESANAAEREILKNALKAKMFNLTGMLSQQILDIREDTGSSPDSSLEVAWKELLIQLQVGLFKPGKFFEVDPSIISYECSTRPNGKALIYVRKSFEGLFESIKSVHNAHRAQSTASDQTSQPTDSNPGPTTNATQDQMESNAGTGSTTATDQTNPTATATERHTDESPASTTTAIATPITGPGKKYLITGTPGTGKSCFAYYLLHHLLAKEGDSVLYQNCHKDSNFFVVIRRSTDSGFKIEHYRNNDIPKPKLGFLDKLKVSDSAASEKPVSWYIFDSGHKRAAKPESTDVPTIVISSPDCDQYKDFMQMCPEKFYMPTWEWTEIEAVVRQLHPDKSEEMNKKIQRAEDDCTQKKINNEERYEIIEEAFQAFPEFARAYQALLKHGGVIREVLNPYSEDRLTELHERVDRSNVEMVLQFLQARGDVSSAVSHRILHQKCDKKLENGLVDYQNPSIGFASDYVFDRFWAEHLEKKADITLEQLSRMYELVPTDAESIRRNKFGEKFEELVHRTLESGNHFGKPLKFRKEPKSKPIKLTFNSIVERESRYSADPKSSIIVCTIATKDTDSTAYVYPSSKTFPAIDAFLPGQKYLIQITIAEDHPVAVPELLAFIASRGWHPKETTLVFVVLDQIYASFQYQMPDDGDTLSEEQSSDFRKIRQYALPLPRLTSELRRNSSK